MGHIIPGSTQLEDDSLLDRYRKLDTEMYMVSILASQLSDHQRPDASKSRSNAETTSGTTIDRSRLPETASSTHQHSNAVVDSTNTAGVHNELRLNRMASRYGLATAAAAVAASTPITATDVQRVPSQQHYITLAHICAAFLSQNPQFLASVAPILGPDGSTVVASAMLSMAANLDPQNCQLLSINPQSNESQNVRISSDRLVESMFDIILRNSDGIATIGPQLGVVVPDLISSDHAAVMGLEMVNDYLAAQDGLPYNSQQQQTRPPVRCTQCQTFTSSMWFPVNDGSHLCTSCADSSRWSVVEPSISTLFHQYLNASDENDDVRNFTVSARSNQYAAPTVLTNAQLRNGRQQTQSGQQTNTNASQQTTTNLTLPYQDQLAATIAAMSAVANAPSVQQANTATFANNNNRPLTQTASSSNNNNHVNGHQHNQQQQSHDRRNAAAIIATQQLQALMPQLFQYFKPIIQLQSQRPEATDQQPSTQSTPLNLRNEDLNPEISTNRIARKRKLRT